MSAVIGIASLFLILAASGLVGARGFAPLSALGAAGDSPSPAMGAYADTLWLMREARLDPRRSAEEKRSAAQKGLNYIRSQVGTQLPIQSLDELQDYFSKHPEMNESLSLNSSQGLGRVVTEFNLLLTSLRVDEKLKGCDQGKRSEGVKVGMAGHDPCRAGTNLKSNYYLKAENEGNRSVYGSPLPTFVSGNVGEILATSMLANFFDEKNDGKDPFYPTLDQVKKALPQAESEGEFTTAAALAQLRGKTYQQAIGREVRNRLSLMYQYQGIGVSELKAIAASSVKEDCQHCTPAMLAEITRSVQGALQADLKHQILKKRESPGAVAQALCERLKANGFPFKGGVEERAIQSDFKTLRTAVVGMPEHARIGFDQQETLKLDELRARRKAILGKLVQEGGDGTLFLTESLADLNGSTPTDTRLRCDSSSAASDSALLAGGVREAIGKTRDYAGRLNSTVNPRDLDLANQRKELDQLVKIAPGAVGEALNTSHPYAASLVCSSLKRLQKEDQVEAISDGAVMWGATVVGVVAMAASRGAAAPLVAGAFAGSAAAGVGAALYSWDESGEAEILAKEYRDAALAQGGDPNLLKLSEEEFLRFKEQRFSAVLSGVFSVAEFANLIAAGAKAGKSMAEINREIERVVANPKEKGNWFKQNARALAADAAVNTAVSAAANGYLTGEFRPNPAEIAMGMVIGASVRRLGKPYQPQEASELKGQLEGYRRDLRESLGRDSTPEELFAAHEKMALKPVEITASKSTSAEAAATAPLPSDQEPETLSFPGKDRVLKLFSLDPDSRTRRQMAKEYPLQVKGLKDIVVRDQGQSSTCAPHGVCSFLQLNQVIPKGKTLDLQYVDGLRIWERMNRLLDIPGPSSRGQVHEALTEGNASEDVVELFAGRGVPYIDAKQAGKTPEMFLSQKRKELEEELASVMTSNASRAEKQKALDLVMRKYYGEVRFNRDIGKRLKGKEFIYLKNSGQEGTAYPERVWGLNKRVHREKEKRLYVVDRIMMKSEKGLAQVTVHDEFALGSADSRKDVRLPGPDSENFLNKLEPVTPDAFETRNAVYLREGESYTRISYDSNEKVVRDYQGNIIPQEKLKDLYAPRDEVISDGNGGKYVFPGASRISLESARTGPMRPQEKRRVSLTGKSSTISSLEAGILGELKQGKAVYAAFTKTNYSKGVMKYDQRQTGGHGVVIVGANQNPDGSLKNVLILNSWGPDKGKLGFYSLPWTEDVEKQLKGILIQRSP